MWIGFEWLRIGTGGGFLHHGLIYLVTFQPNLTIFRCFFIIATFQINLNNVCTYGSKLLEDCVRKVSPLTTD